MSGAGGPATKGVRGPAGKVARALGLFGPAVAAAVLIGADLVVFLSGAEHHGGFWNAVPLWDLAFGFVGGSLLILGAKTVVKPALGRSETYYADEPADDGEPLR